MSISDIIFLALVLGLPVLVSARLFQVEPVGRPFLGTYFLAILGTAFVYAAGALVLTVTGLNALGMFDGIFAIMAAIPIALVVGLIVRSRRGNEKTFIS